MVVRLKISTAKIKKISKDIAKRIKKTAVKTAEVIKKTAVRVAVRLKNAADGIKEKDIIKKNGNTVKQSLMLAALAVFSFAVILMGVNMADKPKYGPPLSPSENITDGIGNGTPAETIVGEAKTEPVGIVNFLGEVIPGSLFGSSAYGTFNSAADRGENFFALIENIIAGGDHCVASLGCVLSSSDPEPAVKPEKPSYWVRGEANYAELLKNAGIDSLALTSDRLNDYGDVGLEDTRSSLESASLGAYEGGDYIKLELGGALCVICFVNAGEEYEANRDFIKETADRLDAELVIAAVYGFSGMESGECEAIARRFADECSAHTVGLDGGEVRSEKYNGYSIYYSLGTLLDGAGIDGTGESVLLSFILCRGDDGSLVLEVEELKLYSSAMSWIPTPEVFLSR